MKGRILTVMITALVTIILIAVAVYLIFGFSSKPGKIMSVNSPQGSFEAYVVESPSADPPKQSLFIAKAGTGEFRLVASLPEDIESAHKIYWTEDGNKAIFVTSWHLFVTDVQTFNTMKISLNPDWWKMHEGKKTFSSSGTSVVMEELILNGSDSLTYRTNLMTQPVTVSLTGL